MSLPACQQRVLDTIERALQRREPRLASMFSMFARLNTNEVIPRTERLDTPPWWAWRRRQQRRHPGGRRREGRRTVRLRAILVFPLVAMAVVAAVFLGMTSSRIPCTPSSGPHGPASSSLSHNTKTCASASGPRRFGSP